ncbi:hypothetical protein [Clostridium manihotivorum]|uniref:hypothetical protein n=1 Tax=Clostridium manihotivorum TaxID=2320868 RepID=UPI0013E2EDC5|nr:hypothetical protein [Clostridium manihotivorum]
MKFLAFPIILAFNIYLINFAKYQWKNNKLGSIGSVLLAIVAIVLPILVILIR